MHEWSLVEEIIVTATAEANKRGASRVLSIEISVGALTGVVPEMLLTAYEIARDKSILAHADMKIVIEQARALCPACAQESTIQGFELVCAHCGAIGLKVLSGDGLHLRKMELELKEPVGASHDAEQAGQDGGPYV